MYNYVVSAQKPTSVAHSVVGNFTSPTDLNLVVGCALTRQQPRPCFKFEPVGAAATWHVHPSASTTAAAACRAGPLSDAAAYCPTAQEEHAD